MSERKLLPLQYHVEFYKNTLRNDPVFSIETSTPPVAFVAGDMIDPRTWEVNDLPANKIYKVTQVTHLIWRIDGSHVSQKLLVVLTTIDLEK